MGSAYTERDKLRASLRLADGRRLDTHPAYVYVRGMLAHIVDDGTFWMSKGEVDSLKTRTLFPRVWFDILDTIMTLEEMLGLLRQSNAEVRESTDLIHASYNKITTVREVLFPQLQEITQQLRQSRMTAETEMKATLSWLKTVREFFMEKDYEREMQRMREFVAMCKEIKALKDDGTLEAVAELAIKLGCGGEK